jgi:PKD repeat protein
VLKEVFGASATNTITFDGGDIDSVTLQFNSSTNGDNTLTFDGADYFVFKDMRIESDGSAGIAVHMYNAANYNRISGCVVQANPSVVSTYSHPLCLTGNPTSPTTYGDNGNYNVFEDNTFIGGYYGVTMSGQGSSALSEGNEFRGNHFTRSYYYGLYFWYNSGVVFEDNTIDGFRNTYNYGMYVYYTSNFSWQRNTIVGSYYGNFFSYPNYYGYQGNRSIFANNMISGDNTNYALYSYYMTNTDFYHNSIYGKGSYLMYMPYNSSTDMRNNIFYYEGSTYCFYLYNPSFVEWDYNDIVVKGGNAAYISGSVISTVSGLAAWNSNYNQNNYEEDPDFINKASDLHVGKKFPELWGANVGVLDDRDGDLRCKFAPSIGADEFNQVSLPPTANFLAPDTAWLGSPTVMLNSNKPSKTAGATWYVNGVMFSDSIHLEYTPTNTGMDTITLIMENCSGTDTLTKMVFVSPILRAPDADFSATSVDIYTGDIMRLLDLSDNGATQWTWDISPKLVYDPFLGISVPPYYGFDTASANPSGYFDYPGVYTIKLKVANSFGADSLTRTAYIKVRQASKMCDIPFDTDGEFGTLYDDGGATGSYSAGLNGLDKCTYLISSCRGEIEFDIDQFDLGDDDYLKVYDGEDDGGRPLWDAANYPDGMSGNKADRSVVTSFTSKSGSAYFVFESDNNTQTVGKGFAIDWEYVPVTWVNPVASINGPDTACTGFPTVFENTSTGNWSYVEWDIDGDGIMDGQGETFSHTFTTPGTDTVMLKAYSLCAGPDSVYRTIVIEDATKPAKPDVMTANQVVSAGDTVTLSGSADYCVSGFAWEITPANYILANNSQLTDQDIDVVFTRGGFYTVELESFNPMGKDSVIKANYIQVLDYCIPSVVNLDDDLGISRVAFADIDNSSSQGRSGYTSYLHLSTEVERGYSYPITVERNSANKAMSRNVWIDWNIDGDFDDAGELVASEASATTMSFTDTIKIDPMAKAGKTRMRVGTNYKNMKNIACGPHAFGEFEDYSIVILKDDKTAPVLTLDGALTDTIEVFGTWTEPGFSATDLVDGNLTSSVVVTNGLDNTTVGTYTVVYEVEDASQNKATRMRTIVVLDRTNPTISLKGADTAWIQIFTSYTDAGYDANDNYDDPIVANELNNVDTANLGTYEVTYCVTDASGNGPICVTRTVVVGDTIAPTVALNGNSPEIVDVFSNYTDEGVTASDNHDYVVTLSGTWDGVPDSLGVFTRTYTVTDPAGNMVSITREIEVVDRVAPTISLEGDLVVDLKRWEEYTDAGYTVADNYYDEADITVTVGGTFENTQSEGVYTITYTAEDPSGNTSSTVQRLIVVGANSTGDIVKDGYTLYPNPTSGSLVVHTNLDNGATAQLRVLDLTGRELHRLGNHVISNGQFALDLSNLATGTYYIEIASADARVVEKVVIAR